MSNIPFPTGPYWAICPVCKEARVYQLDESRFHRHCTAQRGTYQYAFMEASLIKSVETLQAAYPNSPVWMKVIERDLELLRLIDEAKQKGDQPLTIAVFAPLH